MMLFCEDDVCDSIGLIRDVWRMRIIMYVSGERTNRKGGGGRGGEASWRRKGSGTKIWPSIPLLFVSHVSGGADGLGWDYVEEDDFNSDIIGEDSLTHPPHPPHPPPLSPLLSSPLSAPLSNSSPLPSINQVLPTYSGKAGDGEPLLESLIWLLLTSEVPTKEQVDSLTAELHERSSKLPKHVVPLLNSLPKDMHPMTQFSIGLNAAQTASVFAKAYGERFASFLSLSLSLFPSPPPFGVFSPFFHFYLPRRPPGPPSCAARKNKQQQSQPTECPRTSITNTPLRTF